MAVVVVAAGNYSCPFQRVQREYRRGRKALKQTEQQSGRSVLGKNKAFAAVLLGWMRLGQFPALT